MRGIVGLQALVSWITSKRNSMNPDSGASKLNRTQQQGIYLLVLVLVPAPESLWGILIRTLLIVLEIY